jgi:uncharacterized protein YoxC
MDRAREILAAVVWLAAVAVISLGAAGLVAAMDPPPAGGTRPELTQRGDAQVTPALDAIVDDLQRLSDDVTALDTEARTALASLNGRDLESVQAAVDRGDQLVERIRDRSAAVRQAFAAVPLIGTSEADFEVSDAVRERYDRLHELIGSTDAVDAAWARLTTGSLAASRLSEQLAAHDDAVVRAAEQGRDAAYDDAAITLDEADAALDQASRLRDQLKATVDVTTLDQWIERNAAYDAALRDLYVALRDVGGRVTKDVRAAIDAERAAKARLPPDTRGLVVIMAEIGRGGMNSAVITIAETRGRLTAALAEDAAGPDGSAPIDPTSGPGEPGPTGAPTPPG